MALTRPCVVVNFRSAPMPKFRVTTDNGTGPESDDEPLDFENERAATDDAQLALTEMAKDAQLHGKAPHFGVDVEDAAGKHVYRADLDFSSKDGDDMDREDRETKAVALEIARIIGGQPRKR